MRLAKTGLKSLSLTCHNKAWLAPAQPSLHLVWHRLENIICEDNIFSPGEQLDIVGVIPKTAWLGWWLLLVWHRHRSFKRPVLSVASYLLWLLIPMVCFIWVLRSPLNLKTSLLLVLKGLYVTSNICDLQKCTWLLWVIFLLKTSLRKVNALYKQNTLHFICLDQLIAIIMVIVIVVLCLLLPYLYPCL